MTRRGLQRCIRDLFDALEDGSVMPEIGEVLALNLLCVRHGLYAESKRLLHWLERNV